MRRLAILFTGLLNCALLASTVSAKKDISVGTNKADQVLNEDEVTEEKQDTFMNEKRNAIDVTRSYYKRWPGGVIPYDFHSSIAPSTRKTIEDAVETFKKHSCVKFRRRKRGEYYVEFLQGNGCSSSIGYWGWTRRRRRIGKQTISIGKGCEGKGVILHEMMHCIGFWHEQSRLDRNEFVKIDWNNIIDGFEGEFDKVKNPNKITTFGLGYDYDGIMHYGQYTFSKNGKKTIEVVDRNFRGSIGQRSKLSKIDLDQINMLYSCIIATGDGYTKWTAWSPCTAHCKKQRERYCGKKEAKKCKNGVRGQLETKMCEKCQVDGNWGAWGQYQPVAKDMRGVRARKCDNPSPYHGRNCHGRSTEIGCVDFADWCKQDNIKQMMRSAGCRRFSVEGKSPAKECPNSCTKATCKVDGGWSDWTRWSQMTGDRHSKRTRACNNPPPEGGQQCPGSAAQTECRDWGYNNCRQLAGECRARKDVWNRCPRTCGNCKKESEMPKCYDRNPKRCQSWTSVCRRRYTFQDMPIAMYCAKTCGKC